MSESERVIRTFDVELAADGDGRTIDLRVVPYNVVATVADPPDYTAYEELWVPGVFQKQMQAANRVAVFLNFEHDQGVRGIVGHGAELQDEEDGLYGSFRVHKNSDGDKTLDLVREGILTGVSLEAIPIRSVDRDGVVERVRAHLDKVSLCRTGRPAYEQAQVLAVRTKPVIPRPEPLPDELLDRLEHFGIKTPERRQEDMAGRGPEAA